MGKPLYSQERLNRAVRASDACAAARPAKKVSEAAGDLRVEQSIPKELYWNAVVGHGVDPSDSEYWRDMERVVPSIAVKSSSGRVFFGQLNRFCGPRKLRNRFGLVSFRKVYS